MLAIHIPLQEVPAKSKESEGGPWQLVGLLPLFDPPRHDSAETIRQALNLGVNVKMISGKSLQTSIYSCYAFVLILLHHYAHLPLSPYAQGINLLSQRKLVADLEWEQICTHLLHYLVTTRMQA